MTTTRTWNPFAEMERMLDDLNRLVSAPGGGTPPVDVHADDDAVAVTTELPGVALDAVRIELDGDALSISAQRPPADTADGTTWHRRERPGGTFARVVQLPYAVDVDRAQARLRDGVLTVTLPRAAADRPRRIAVQAA